MSNLFKIAIVLSILALSGCTSFEVCKSGPNSDGSFDVKIVKRWFICPLYFEDVTHMHIMKGDKYRLSISGIYVEDDNVISFEHVFNMPDEK